MPPQFFKDAHNSMSSKFVPRSFSLNLQGKNFEHMQRVNAIDSSNDSASNDSIVTPKASSTAPSTGSSSKLFGGYTTKTSKKSEIEIGSESILQDSSLDRIVDIVKGDGLNPKVKDGVSLDSVCNTEPREELDDDDLQITDIRDVSLDENFENDDFQQFQKAGKPGTETYASNSESSSGDLLLEALFKSQKLCASYKEQLCASSAKVSSQEETISKQNHHITGIKSALEKFKEHMDSLRQATNEIYALKDADNQKLSILKSDRELVAKRVSLLKNETSALRVKLDHLKELKISTGYELEKKDKEISHLRQQLDETSGLLSEQKIKSSNLERTLQLSRKDYDQKISEFLANQENFRLSLESKCDTMKEELEGFSRSEVFQKLLPQFTIVQDTLKGEMEALSLSFSKSLNIYETSMTKLESVVHQDNENFNLEFTNKFENMEKSFGSATMKYKSFDELLTKISSCVQGLACQINADKEDHSVEDACTDVKSLINDVLEEIHKIGTESTERNQKLVDLNLKANQELAELQRVIESNMGTIQGLHNDIDDLSKEKSDLIAKIEHLSKNLQERQEELQNKESQIKMCDQRTQKCKLSCESKMRTQNEIHRMVSDEKNKLKQDLEKELESAKNIVSELENYKSLTDSLTNELSKQKSNYEIRFSNAQAAAQKLEAENQFLRSKMEDMKLKLDNDPADASQTSNNDLELTISKIPVRSLKSVVDTKRNKSQNTLTTRYSKRKTLLDDSDDKDSLFDEFELDSVEDIRPPAPPKRYTKRKRITTRD